MFKSGFLIFISFRDELAILKKLKDLPNLYKDMIINNKLTLVKNNFQKMNMNSLRFIMIKLGLIYRELFMIKNCLNQISGYDMKTANLLMQYILETSDIEYIRNNDNDDFYISIIKITINYLIKLFESRTQKLKGNRIINELKFMKNMNFVKYYQSIKEFKELVILSKYLDFLRDIDNKIYTKRNSSLESLKLKINNMCVKVQDKEINNKDINYLKIQLFMGKLSDSQNYVIRKVRDEIPDKISIKALNRAIVEIYCYFLLQDSDMFSVCINILRNVSINPNLFFKNISMSTQLRPLRSNILNHLKHSNFTSVDELQYMKLIKYIERNYSNPSFSVEYNKKACKIMNFKEFTLFRLETDMINRNYFPNAEYKKMIEEKKEGEKDKEKKVLTKK